MDKKRKLQHELPEMPLAKKLQSNQFGRGGESEPESANSNSYSFNSDSTMYTDNEAKSRPEFSETYSSDTPPSSSSTSYSSFDTFGSYSSESTSSTNLTSSGRDLYSTIEQPDCPRYAGQNGPSGSCLDSGLLECRKDSIDQQTQHEGQHGQFGSGLDFSLLEYGQDSIDQQPDCPQHEGQDGEFGCGSGFSLLEYRKDSIDQQPDYLRHEGQYGSGSDFSLLDYRKDSIDQQRDCPRHEGQKGQFASGSDEECIDKEFENLFCSNRSNSKYVLSSGRWPVNQDDKKEGKTPTIDKEFGDYFSMLML